MVPSPRPLRGLFLAACATLLFSVPVVAALSISDAAYFSAASFVGYKALWGGLLGGAFSPIIAWWALADASRRTVTASASASASADEA